MCKESPERGLFRVFTYDITDDDKARGERKVMRTGKTARKRAAKAKPARSWAQRTSRRVNSGKG